MRLGNATQIIAGVIQRQEVRHAGPIQKHRLRIACRTSQKKTLHFIAPDPSNDLELLGRFHPFDDDLHVEIVRQGDQGMNHGFRFWKIQYEINALVYRKLGTCLNRKPVLVQIKHLAEINHHSTRGTVETCIGWCVRLVTNAAPALSSVRTRRHVVNLNETQFHGLMTMVRRDTLY